MVTNSHWRNREPIFHPGWYLGQGLGLSSRDVDCLLHDLFHDSRLGAVATIGRDSGTTNTTIIRDGDINVIDIIIGVSRLSCRPLRSL
jgi:hypothetical protein